MDDDSLISYTESKLDRLYRQTAELREGLKVTDKHIKTAKTRAVKNKLESIEQDKRMKLQAFLE